MHQKRNLAQEKKKAKDTNIKTESTRRSPKPASPSSLGKTGDIINIAICLIFVALTYWLMAVKGANYLRRMESLSIFLPTADFFHDCLREPGGLITWASTYLTQTLYYPWLGTTVYLLIMGITVWCTLRAFHLGRYALSAAMVIPALEILALLDFGYLIFSLKTSGYAFQLPLGILTIVLIYWLFKQHKAWWEQILGIVVTVVAGYPLLGVYALAAAAICAISSFRAKTERRAVWQAPAVALVAVLLIVFLPKYYALNIHSDIPLAFIYRSPLPRFYADEGNMWTPSILSFVAMLIFALYHTITSGRNAAPTKIRIYVSGAIGAAALCAVIFGRYDDPNFYLSMDLEQAVWDGDWQKATEKMASYDQEPTRLNVILSTIASIRSGEAADHLFELPTGGAPYSTTRSMRVAHDAGAALLSYHTGLINYAYRWAMESKVEYGMNVEQLKLMTKTALLNGDYGVARKCLDNLALTAHHKDWAKKYREYADDPSLISKDPELAAIKPLMCDTNSFIEDKGQLEGYVWRTLANVEEGGEEMLNLALISGLICRDIEAFAARLPFYARLHPDMPVYYQEGLLLWSKMHENDAFRRYKIQPEVKDRFVRFLKAQEQYSRLSTEEQKRMLKPTFGDTYWFYAYYEGDCPVI